MQDNRYFPMWKSWLRIGRLIPLLTISAAVTVEILSLFGLFEVTMSENVIIGLLTLLAADALVERLTYLEKIDERLERLPEPELLRDRSQLIRMEDLAANAKEICAAGMSLISIIPPYVDFYIQKLRDGCNLRFLLLDPKSRAVTIGDQELLSQTMKNEIETSLRVLNKLIALEDSKGKCEVRLSRARLPFSMVIIDSQKDLGRMTVEFLAYKKDLRERPHIQLTKRDNYKWFQFFYNQFESLWQENKDSFK